MSVGSAIPASEQTALDLADDAWVPAARVAELTGWTLVGGIPPKRFWAWVKRQTVLEAGRRKAHGKAFWIGKFLKRFRREGEREKAGAA